MQNKNRKKMPKSTFYYRKKKEKERILKAFNAMFPDFNDLNSIFHCQDSFDTRVSTNSASESFESLN